MLDSSQFKKESHSYSNIFITHSVTLFVLAPPSHPCSQLISQPPQWKCLKYTLKCSNTLPLVLPRLRPRSETRAWNSYSNASRGRVRLVRTSAHSSSVVCIRLGSCVLWNCVKVALASLGAEVITLSLLHCQTDKTGQVHGSNLPLKPVTNVSLLSQGICVISSLLFTSNLCNDQEPCHIMSQSYLITHTYIIFIIRTRTHWITESSFSTLCGEFFRTF